MKNWELYIIAVMRLFRVMLQLQLPFMYTLSSSVSKGDSNITVYNSYKPEFYSF